MQPLHSCFSLRFGVRKPDELVVAAHALGLRTLLLTDINNTSATLDFYQKCLKNDIKPVIGIEFRRNGTLLFTGIARSNEGFFQLTKLLTEWSLNNKQTDIAPQMPDTFIVYEKLSKPINLFEKNEFLPVFTFC
jgi:DNA polymerase III alpha subunit